MIPAAKRRPRARRAPPVRPTRAEIDHSAFVHNLGEVRRVVGAAQVIPVLKANGYGHGAVPIARRLESEGVTTFAVALVEEGLDLREAGVKGEIIVLNGVFGGAHREILDAGLTPVVYDLAQVDALAAVSDREVGVHVKIDTGMSRLGVPHREFPRFVEALARRSRIRVNGAMTHFAAAESDDPLNALQLTRFDDALALLRGAGHEPSLVHAGNSAGALRIASAHFDAVRVGLSLYGGAVAGVDLPLRPAMRIRSEVVALRRLQAGDRVGYDGTFEAAGPTLIATVPLGYGDGLMRANSNRGVGLVRGVRCPLVGNVSMDLTTFDVTHVRGVSVGDEVVVLGSQQGATITPEELGETSGTLAYEVWCAVSRRVPRVHF